MPNLKLKPAERAHQRRRADGDDPNALLAALANPGLTSPILFTQTASLDTPSATSSASPSTITVTVLPSVLSSATSSAVPSTTPATSTPATITPASTLQTSMPPSYASAYASQSSGVADKSTATASSSNKSSKGVPVAAIVIPVLVAVLIIIAFVVLLLRKRLMGKRERKRGQWTQNLFPEPFPPPGEPGGDPEQAMDQVRATNPTPFAAGGGMPPPPPPAVAPAVPQMSYNNPVGPISMPVPEPAPAPAGASVSSFGSVVTYRRDSAPIAVVRSTFLPSLPDELSISAGELVRVISEFDDGWALCETAGGGQGMVPLECLDTGDLPSPMRPRSTSSGGGWRNSKRASSLGSMSGVGSQPSGRF